MHKPSNFNVNSIEALGIDRRKAELIKFLIDSEGLDYFAETEHFFYWSFKMQKVLSDTFNFIKSGPFMHEIDGKEYDINSFEGVSQMIVDVKSVLKIDGVFSGPPLHAKREFMLRYSKKYKRLEYYTWFHTIEKNRTRDKYYIRHAQHKFFSIDERNNVRIYLNRWTVRYISNKSVIYFKGHDFYRNADNNFYLKLNRRLLNIHLKSDLYNSDERFMDSNMMLNHLSNKLFKGCNSLEEILNKATKNRPVPKILKSKLPVEEIISLYNFVEYDEMDKIIKFMYQYHDFVNMGTNYFQILFNYMCLRVGVMKADREKMQFDLIQENAETNPFGFVNNGGGHEVRDYIRILVSLDKKINLNIRSMKRLRLEHDELARKVVSSKIPKIKVHRSYPVINSAEGFTIERIEDKNRLVAESDIQNHCVKTYASQINKGTCCIYSFLDRTDGRRYTLEIQMHKNPDAKEQVFVLNQIRGKFNSNPPNETLLRAVSVLNSIGIYPSKEEAVKNGYSFLEKKMPQRVFLAQNNNVVVDDDDLPF